MLIMRNALTVLLLSLSLTGLADTDCETGYFALQQALARAGIGDAQARTLTGFPHLGVNRWLAFQQRKAVSEPQQQQWIRLATAKAWRDQSVLVQRLTTDSDGFSPQTAQTLLASCLPVLAARTDFSVLPQAEIPDSYATWLRVAGMYPLMAWLATGSIDDYHREMSARFRDPARQPRQQFSPPTGGTVPVAPDVLSANPLRIPLPDTEQWQAMLSHYAPVVAVSDTQPWNVPGQIQLDETHTPVIRTETPVSYTWPSWTHFRGKNLLQINYQFWFSKRPKRGWLDTYAGSLDGVIWRVTLKPNGKVLFYDSIHPCGCYHKIYLVDPTLKAADIEGDKPVFYPGYVVDAYDQRITLLLEPDTHYLVRVTPTSDLLPTSSYQLADANALRALKHQDGTVASLFNARGLVPISKRAERFYLWPMGIPSAGAMRQPGEHAIAFKGRRHFDEATLAETLFE
ncbi:MAG: hypothetical protein AOY29_08475 [Alcanivorax borkumensis]|jgi:hypothetical protein|uniref:Uncharacterized protein n=2 Tax=Alcanivorax TaxID=59753 RepID=Q0VTF4_ALCBS|nr:MULTISPECIES: hypothetical protein [Alcanivorax]OJH08832.1 MAG: hypothetical protein AOY29_08475 [Alcanivorax borkumensis]CAL15508.1 hypothetical protein ABO_0060 [Alcanivorax borkumensis SK2]